MGFVGNIFRQDRRNNTPVEITPNRVASLSLLNPVEVTATIYDESAWVSGSGIGRRVVAVGHRRWYPYRKLLRRVKPATSMEFIDADLMVFRDTCLFSRLQLAASGDELFSLQSRGNGWIPALFKADAAKPGGE
jgi:hypothetical protein